MGPKAPEPLWTQDGSSAPLPHCREPPMPKPGTRVCVLMDARSHGDDHGDADLSVSDGGPYGPMSVFLTIDLRVSS